MADLMRNPSGRDLAGLTGAAIVAGGGGYGAYRAFKRNPKLGALALGATLIVAGGFVAATRYVPATYDVDMRDAASSAVYTGSRWGSLQGKSKRNARKPRDIAKIDGIVLHQTGIHEMGQSVYPKVTAHVFVDRHGNVYWLHPVTTHLFHTGYLNSSTLGIEVEGNFVGHLDEPDKYWTPGGGPSQLTPAQARGVKRAIKFLVKQTADEGGEIKRILAHRQAASSRAGDPGQEIWESAGVWAQKSLGLNAGGPGYTVPGSDGLPLTQRWGQPDAVTA